MSAPLRALLPRPPGDGGRASVDSANPKRARTKVACRPCSQKKFKCDGARPTCLRCHERSVECCYDIAEGQTRNHYLKRKNEALQRDLGGTLDLLWHIQHGSEHDAVTIVRELRGGKDPSTILASLSLLGLGLGEAPSQRDSSSTSLGNTPTGATASTAAVAPARALQQKQTAQPLPHNVTRSNNSVAIPDFSDTALLASALRLQSAIFKHAFSVFLQCTAKIFHIYTQDEVDNLLDSSLRESKTIPLHTICEACSIAAVGSRYSRSQIAPEHGDYYFTVAKQLLDDCIEKAPLQAVKVCAMLVVCNLINKATSAFAYVELGLGVGRLQGLDARERPPHLDMAAWVDGKKVFRSLLLCRGWLQATLSYVPTVGDPIRVEDMEVESNSAPDDNELFQTQVAKFTVIKAGIFRRMQNASFSLQLSRAIRRSLDEWLEALPEHSRLENLAKPSISQEARISGLYLNSFYLGGKMLAYRWILSWVLHEKQSGRELSSELEKETARCADEGILAAKQSADTLYALYAEGAAVRHCWLCIFQGYLSCCILLYDLFQKQLRLRDTESYAHNLALASKALEVLSWSGQLDPTASKYHAILYPLYDYARATKLQPSEDAQPITEGHDHFVSYSGTGHLQTAARKLSRMLYVPLSKDESSDGTSVQIYRPSLEQTATSLDEVALGVHLSWALEFTTVCGRDGENGQVQASGLACLQRATQQFGSFAGGGQPPGWSLNRPFVEASYSGMTNIFK